MKEGDIIFCVDSSDHSKKQKLTYGKGYTIERYGSDHHGNLHISIINDSGIIGNYNFNRFVTLSKWREIRLNEILEE
jgi:hypothetical protein